MSFDSQSGSIISWYRAYAAGGFDCKGWGGRSPGLSEYVQHTPTADARIITIGSDAVKAAVIKHEVTKVLGKTDGDWLLIGKHPKYRAKERFGEWQEIQFSILDGNGFAQRIEGENDEKV